jgi:hypothetical protein
MAPDISASCCSCRHHTGHIASSTGSSSGCPSSAVTAGAQCASRLHGCWPAAHLGGCAAANRPLLLRLKQFFHDVTHIDCSGDINFHLVLTTHIEIATFGSSKIETKHN